MTTTQERQARSQHLDHIAVGLWLAAIVFMFVGGFIYTDAGWLSLVLWGVGAWFVVRSHAAGDHG